MESIYVLKLENHKWYVGKTIDVERRFKQHQSGLGSSWTKKHPPIEIFEQRPSNGPNAEDDITEEYRTKYGANNVRGGTYLGGSYSSSYMRIAWRGKMEHDKRCMVDGLCLNCHNPGHFSRECKEQSVFMCYPCGTLFKTEKELITHENICNVEEINLINSDRKNEL
jgi:predicted GIY-YIG superfamily endonuclease